MTDNLISVIHGHCLCLEQPCDMESCAPCRLVEELEDLRRLRDRVLKATRRHLEAELYAELSPTLLSPSLAKVVRAATRQVLRVWMTCEHGRKDNRCCVECYREQVESDRPRTVRAPESEEKTP